MPLISRGLKPVKTVFDSLTAQSMMEDNYGQCNKILSKCENFLLLFTATPPE